MTVIIGPNGCGKSTLLKCIGRFIRPSAGRIFLGGMDVLATPTKQLAREMAVLPQSPITPAGLAVGDMVGFGRHPYQSILGRSSREDEAVVEWALKVTSLSGLGEEPVDSLSGGQRQRTWIAMTLAQKTGTILLDEPTTYLGIAYQLDILELLERLNLDLGKTIVIVLHDINLSARFADCMVAMKNGHIVKVGSPDEVVTAEVLREIYGIEAIVTRDPKHGTPVLLSYERCGDDILC